MNDRQKGLAITTFAMILVSPDALTLRWLSVSATEMLAWRGAFMAVGLSLLLTWRYKATLPYMLYRTGWAGFGCAFSYCMSTTCYVHAIQLTGAANTLIIYSLTPLIAAVMTWLCLREKLKKTDFLAILFCIVGVSLIFFDTTYAISMLGNLLALVAATLLACNLVLARSCPKVDMSPTLIPSTLMVSFLGFALGDSVSFTTSQWCALAFMAGLLLPLAVILIQIGPRWISATEVSLLLLLEIVLGPIWVWLFLEETITIHALLGGVVILSALLIHSLASLK